MATQVALGSSLAAEAPMESAGCRLRPWWPISPSLGKVVLLSSNTMKWRPIFMSLVMSCTKSALRSVAMFSQEVIDICILCAYE